MIEYKILEELGIGEKEAAVYAACLQYGPAGAAVLAKQTGIQRTHLYDLAKKMVNKGMLVQTRKDGRKVFSAVSPRSLFEVQKRKLKRFEKNIPELEKLGNREDQRPKIVYYEGEKELNKMMAASIMGGGECLIFCDDEFYSKSNGEYQKKNIKQRLETDTSCRLLAGLTNATLASKKKDKEEMRETRFLPRDIFESKVLVALYRDKTLVANHAKNFGFVVEDRDFTDTLAMIFNLIWNSGRIIE